MPTGPWYAMHTVYELKELVPSTPGWDKDAFCYAKKEHIEFAEGANLFITYSADLPANTMSFRLNLASTEVSETVNRKTKVLALGWRSG
ncbi:MAG: hypothetical protein WBQ59_13215 [Candidatus Acidiferrum sp.]